MATQKKGPSPKKRGQKKEKETNQQKNDSTTRNLKMGLFSIAISIAMVALAIIVQKKFMNKLRTKDLEANNKDNDNPDRQTITIQMNPKSNTASKLANTLPWQRPVPRVAFFFKRVCDDSRLTADLAYCNESLRPSHRILRAEKRIEVGEKLFEIPRSMQIWDLDALRDPFVRKHLFKATHKTSGNKLGSEAYLSAYIALQLQAEPIDVDYKRWAYFDALPTMKEYAYHPMAVPIKGIKEVLGKSYAFEVVEAYVNMFLSEYEAFRSASPEFAKKISSEDYYFARLHVLTHSMRVGPPGASEEIQWNLQAPSFVEENDLLDDELQAYKDMLGMDLKRNGCVALVPLADFFNHHPRSNVEFDFASEKDSVGSIAVRVVNYPVEEGSEPMVSYGAMADSHLFARYGFVNGDGSGHTQVRIAHYHTILRLNISSPSQYDYLPNQWISTKFNDYQLQQMALYIRFDDGHQECIPGKTSHPEEAKLKIMKHKHLIKIANDIEKWVTLMPPRNPYAQPALVSSLPTSFDVPAYFKNFTVQTCNIDNLLETCRLISLINDDFDGMATQMLEDNLENDNFVVGEGGLALEIRSLFCVGRLVGFNLLKLEQEAGIAHYRDQVISVTKTAFRTLKWAAVHLRFSEMQALEALGNIIAERIESKWSGGYADAREIFKIRDDPCPKSYSAYLFEDDKEDPLLSV